MRIGFSTFQVLILSALLLITNIFAIAQTVAACEGEPPPLPMEEYLALPGVERIVIESSVSNPAGLSLWLMNTSTGMTVDIAVVDPKNNKSTIIAENARIVSTHPDGDPTDIERNDITVTVEVAVPKKTARLINEAKNLGASFSFLMRAC